MNVLNNPNDDEADEPNEEKGLPERIDPAKITDSLEPDGPMSTLFRQYEYREAQVQMAAMVTEAFNDNRIAVAEAGTGVGKSLAYLLPAVEWAAVNREKVVISTATINLQQQIAEKDIPLARQILNRSVDALLVKGRGHYLCLRRLHEALEELSLFEEDNETLTALEAWAEKTQTGDRSELAFSPDATQWSRVCSEGDNCLGARCRYREACFVVKMKKRAAAADLLVVNHHLLFADLAYRLESGGFDQAAVLPPFKKVIFDEAHNIEGSATGFFSDSFNRFSIRRLLGRMVSVRKERYSGLIVELKRIDFPENWIGELPQAVEKALQAADLADTAAVAAMGKEGSRRFVPKALSESDRALLALVSKLHAALSKVQQPVSKINQALPDEVRHSPVGGEVAAFLNRLNSLLHLCRLLTTMEEAKGLIFWMKREKTAKGEAYAQWNLTPLTVAPKLREALFEPFETVVCTSATLSIEKSFDYFYRRCGIDKVDPERLLAAVFPSPFPFKTNVLLQVPLDGPEDPNHERFLEYTQRYTVRALEISEGRGLVLFTSNQMLNQVYDYCLPRLQALGIPVFKQGDEDRARLLNRFKEEITSVLFATASFWEGVDSPGETLSIVIIPRLPFSVPTDPINEARYEAIAEKGGNPFMEYCVPDAVMKLKQGFGRLIRSSRDRGVVVVLDGRLIRKRYGSVFLESLPETRRSFKPGASLMNDLESFLY